MVCWSKRISIQLTNNGKCAKGKRIKGNKAAGNQTETSSLAKRRK